MSKKRTIIFLLITILMFSMPLTVNAQNVDWWTQANVVDTKSRYVMSNDSISTVRGAARGRVISSSELQLSDEGSGVIGVYASTLCHTAVEEIYMMIYLDVWDESLQDWVMINDFEYNWKSSDEPDKDLSAASVSFLLEGLSRGRTYSLRGVHIARNFDKVVEVMASETDGITLN